MSAFLVDVEHVRALVDSAVHYGLLERGHLPHAMRLEVEKRSAQLADAGLEPDVPSIVGRILWEENVRSLEYRYPDTKEKPEDRPGTIGEGPKVGPPFDFKARRFHLLPGAVGGAVSCYEYQSCEHPEWEASASADFCRALTKAALKKAPGGDTCPWEIRADEQTEKRDRPAYANEGPPRPYCYPADDSVSILSLIPRRPRPADGLFP